MKRFYLSALFMLFGFTTFLYSQEMNLGPRITAMGNTGVALQDVWSLQSNQAGVSEIKNFTASACYQNSYLNQELSTQSAVVAYSTGRNILGISFQNYGFSAYSEQKIGFTYAKRFGDALSAALNFNVHQVKILQYGSARTISVEGGLQYRFDKRITIGTHFSNPNRSGFNAEVNTTIPVVLEFGASYLLSNKILLNSGFIKALNSEADFRCGMEYSFIDAVAIRGGLGLNPFRQFAGIGYQLKDLKVDAGASTHPQLGVSPQIALSYEF
ncbi:MAG TPA: hypothetical protein VGB63_05270 [Pedobacter sp.]|jgi:hypothetical protein